MPLYHIMYNSILLALTWRREIEQQAIIIIRRNKGMKPERKVLRTDWAYVN